MTANELADELKLYQWCTNNPIIEQAATMLRQQQAEIEALKAHPAKELTQNIIDIYRLSDQSIQIGFTSCRSASEFEAILRKASEK